jgi:phosphonate transport system substrate-binding protein
VKHYRTRNNKQLACLLASVPLAFGLVAVTPSSAIAQSGTNPVNSSWPTSIVFGSVGAEDATSLQASLVPLEDVFKAKLGLTLKVYIGTSYAADIEAQEAGKAQLVEYGPFSYVIALNQGLKIKNIGVVISAPHTDGGYWSWGVVNPKLNPDITSIKDFAGKKVCFSDPASTSGYLYPSYGLIEAGVNPKTGITPVFAGTDTSSPLEVAKGECQAGFTNNLDITPVFTQNHIPRADLKTVWVSPEIPGSPVAVSTTLPASLVTAMENVLDNDGNSAYEASHGYCSSQTACTNESEGTWGYASPSVANYAQVTQICKVTKSPSCKIS